MKDILKDRPAEWSHCEDCICDGKDLPVQCVFYRFGNAWSILRWEVANTPLMRFLLGVCLRIVNRLERALGTRQSGEGQS